MERAFPPSVLKKITEAAARSEESHRGEIRVSIEPRRKARALLRGQSTRERALEVFSLLRVWDTEENNGVLLYISPREQRIEIIADRGVNRLVAPDFWEALCVRIGEFFREERFLDGVLRGIQEIETLLVEWYPRAGEDANELPDEPAIL